MDTRRFLWILLIIRFFSVQSEHHYGNWTLSRKERFLIYADSGSTKLAVSLTIPINLYDKKKWRSFNLTYNFQFQYNMVQKATGWWDVYSWNIMRSYEGRVFVENEPIDLSATFLYAVIENYMNNRGRNGRQCLQRAICQNAQSSQGNSIYEMVYHRLMTPEETMEEYYKTAFEEGSKGVDCFKTYSKCPMGHSVIDQFVQYE